MRFEALLAMNRIISVKSLWLPPFVGFVSTDRRKFFILNCNTFYIYLSLYLRYELETFQQRGHSTYSQGLIIYEKTETENFHLPRCFSLQMTNRMLNWEEKLQVIFVVFHSTMKYLMDLRFCFENLDEYLPLIVNSENH